jgi:large subunit ribosomal protein L37Ae
MRTKKVKSAGRFRAGYGIRVRRRLREVEAKQRKKQVCPFCKGNAKRIAKGIWQCSKCDKKFASGTFYVE